MSGQAHRFLRFFSSPTDAPSDLIGVSPAPPARAPMTAIDRANEHLIGDISDFLTSCRLPVTIHNLRIAHSAFSGEDPQLARAIGQKRMADEPITQEWLDDQVQGEDQDAAIKTLIAQLNETLERFARTTHKARTTTATSNATLAKHVDRAAHSDDGPDMAEILGLAQTILDHNRQLESDIRSSEQETRNLRRLLDRAQHDAEIDHLTGLPNRRAFEAAFDRCLSEAQATIDHLCVAFCDIDNFKLVNDTYGHETGDRVLKAVADTLDRLSNQKCHVARHGGEEFVLLFCGLTKAEARAKLDAVRENFAERRFINRKTDTPIGRVTFSGGVADVFAYPNPRDALRAADEALYLAKAQGRNAVMAAP